MRKALYLLSILALIQVAAAQQLQMASVGDLCLFNRANSLLYVR